MVSICPVDRSFSSGHTTTPARAAKVCCTPDVSHCCSKHHPSGQLYWTICPTSGLHRCFGFTSCCHSEFDASDCPTTAIPWLISTSEHSCSHSHSSEWASASFCHKFFRASEHSPSQCHPSERPTTSSHHHTSPQSECHSSHCTTISYRQQ